MYTHARTHTYKHGHAYTTFIDVSIELHTDKQVKEGQKFYEKLGAQAVDKG